MIWCPFLNHDTQLPKFSEIDEVKKHPAFHATRGRGGEEQPPQVESSSDIMLVTHVSSIALTNS